MTDVLASAAQSVLSAQSVASSGPAALKRLDKTTACLPIVYGSVAYYLGKKADEFQTHLWTLHLRGPNNEDLSAAISKVVFQLHASFAQPTRELTAPPYEVTERGWGEFEAQIRIVWKDPLEKATVVTHGLKLYPPGTPTNAIPTNTDKPVVAETYDEVVFTDPTETFYGQLMQLSSAPTVEYSQEAQFGKFSDTEDFHALLEAQKFLEQELASVKERLLNVDGELVQVDEGLREVQERKVNAAAQRKAAPRGPSASAPPTKKVKAN